jgi:hypothetical protein
MIASLGAMVIYRKYRNKFFHIQELVLLTFLFLLFAVQILITFQGVKPWEHGEWFKKDYSEISSTLFKEKLQPPASNLHPLLITSLPEAYYLLHQNFQPNLLQTPILIFFWMIQ